MKVRLTPAFENMNLVIPLDDPKLRARWEHIEGLTKEIRQKIGETDVPISFIVQSGINADKSDKEIEEAIKTGLRDDRDWTDISFKLKNGRYPTDEENRKMEEETEKRLREGPSERERAMNSLLELLEPSEGE